MHINNICKHMYFYSLELLKSMGVSYCLLIYIIACIIMYYPFKV